MRAFYPKSDSTLQQQHPFSFARQFQILYRIIVIFIAHTTQYSKCLSVLPLCVQHCGHSQKTPCMFHKDAGTHLYKSRVGKPILGFVKFLEKQPDFPL
jgi:hypothetical protein